MTPEQAALFKTLDRAALKKILDQAFHSGTCSGDGFRNALSHMRSEYNLDLGYDLQSKVFAAWPARREALIDSYLGEAVGGEDLVNRASTKECG